MAVERSILTLHVPASLHQVCRGQRPSGSSSLRQRRSIRNTSLFVVAHGDDGARFSSSSSSSFPHVLRKKKKKKKEKGCIIHGALANDAGEQQQQGGRYTTTNNVPHQSSSSSPGIHMYDDDKRKDGSKRIVAEVRVQAQLEDVWGVLTDYEALPGFVPNLEVCERLPSAKPGVTRLRQVGCSQSILWRLEAEAELEVEEVDTSSSWRKEVRFRMVSGDFEELYGRWIVESNMASSAQMSTFLRYDICIQPRFSLPSQITSYIIKAGLPSNIRAIASRAESVSDARLKASGLASWVGTEVNPDIPQPIENASRENAEQDDEVRLPSKGPFWPRGSPYAASAPITAERQNRLAVMDAAKSAYLGTAWVPLPPSGAPENMSVKEALNDELEQKKKTSSGRTYEAISEAELLEMSTQTDRVVAHFFHPDFDRCEIVDKHVSILAPRYFDTWFVKVSVEMAPFMVKKVNIGMLPCTICFQSGVAGQSLVGFDRLGGKDDFDTSILEGRLLESQVIGPSSTLPRTDPSDIANSIRQGFYSQMNKTQSDEDSDFE